MDHSGRACTWLSLSGSELNLTISNCSNFRNLQWLPSAIFPPYRLNLFQATVHLHRKNYRYLQNRNECNLIFDNRIRICRFLVFAIASSTLFAAKCGLCWAKYNNEPKPVNHFMIHLLVHHFENNTLGGGALLVVRVLNNTSWRPICGRRTG